MSALAPGSACMRPTSGKFPSLLIAIFFPGIWAFLGNYGLVDCHFLKCQTVRRQLLYTPLLPSPTIPLPPLETGYATDLNKIIGFDNSVSILKAHIPLLHGLQLKNGASLWSATDQSLIMNWPLVLFFLVLIGMQLPSTVKPNPAA